MLQLIGLFVINHFYQTPHYSNFYEYSTNSFYYAEQLGFPPMLITFLIGWLILGIGNFLNNLRVHNIELRQKEKELIIFREKEKELLISKQKELQSQAELDALQARVNPHFLYNSLNSIAGLAQEDPTKTEEMAIALSHFFKYSTNRQTENWSTIEKEIEILETYLEIEKIRFGERLQFQLTCPEELFDAKIPWFLLQPIVENAIKYGYDQATNSIAIQIEISQNGNQLVFQIYDGGKPFPDDMPAGYGLQSIRKKLALLYPEKHELAFINVPKKQVAITLLAVKE
ncbi:MAG: sensor histidine kinase [Saprospiraceae bacterium]